MKRLIVTVISVILVTGFFLLVYYGLKHSRGIPVSLEETKRPVLEVPLIAKEIDLEKGIEEDFWDTLPNQEIKLLYQVMVLPWPKVVTPAVRVRAFHNSKDIYFYLKWQDDTEDRIIGTNKFSDARAIMFPLSKEAQTPTLIMGFLGRVNIWHWKATRDLEYWSKKEPAVTQAYTDFYYPFEEKETLRLSRELVSSAVSDLVAIRVGTVTPKEKQLIQGRGFYKQGSWQVVIKRSLKVVDQEIDAEFNLGKRLCAFAIWNGSKGDRGGRKSISDWVELVIR